MSKVYVVYLEPIYDELAGMYRKVLTMGEMPLEPLGRYVRCIRTPALTNMNGIGIGRNARRLYVISKALDDNAIDIGDSEYMEAEDIPRLFGYLVSNGYMIESGWTCLLQKSKISLSGDQSGKKTMIFVFRQQL